MTTVSWKDVAFATVAGPVAYRDRILDLGADHITRWRDDPDGRFNLKIPVEEGKCELDRFFPSL